MNVQISFSNLKACFNGHVSTHPFAFTSFFYTIVFLFFLVKFYTIVLSSLNNQIMLYHACNSSYFITKYKTTTHVIGRPRNRHIFK